MSSGSRIRHFRELSEISVSELARRVGVTVTAASNWDHGTSFPRAETLVKVAGALGVSPESLMSMPMAPNASSEPVEIILRDAKAKLAQALGMAESRIQLELRVLA